MYRSITFIALLLLTGILFPGCRPDDHIIYDVNEVYSQGTSSEKGTLKSDAQYLSILYSNLFQRAISADELFSLNDLIESCGDKESIREIILSSWMNAPDKIIPTDQEMRADVDQFIVDTYMRFYVRLPSQAEKAWFRNFINSDPNVSPELVFLSFALSNEYLYY